MLHFHIADRAPTCTGIVEETSLEAARLSSGLNTHIADPPNQIVRRAFAFSER